jgi:hypothetical protein
MGFTAQLVEKGMQVVRVCARNRQKLEALQRDLPAGRIRSASRKRRRGGVVDGPGDQERNFRTVELTSREVELLIEYGHPWPEIEDRLRASRDVRGYHRVPIDAYWIEMMIADVVRSAKEIRSRRLLEELDELCSSLERALGPGAHRAL